MPEERSYCHGLFGFYYLTTVIGSIRHFLIPVSQQFRAIRRI